MQTEPYLTGEPIDPAELASRFETLQQKLLPLWQWIGRSDPGGEAEEDRTLDLWAAHQAMGKRTPWGCGNILLHIHQVVQQNPGGVEKERRPNDQDRVDERQGGAGQSQGEAGHRITRHGE